VGKIDLHVHSDVSDGKFSPEEIVRKAAALGLTTLALADHDSVGGVARALAAAREFPQLTVIPNVEISTDTEDGEVHILGYFVDYEDAALKESLERFRNSRRVRAEKMAERLNEIGVPVSWQRVQELAGDASLGRPHIARALLEQGHVSTFREAFEKYIGYGGPAYVPRDKMTPAEAVQLILKAQGLPGLAHPTTAGAPEKLLPELISAGLVAMEVYYNAYTPEQRRDLAKMAQRHRLIATGGSDYHGIENNQETMLGEAGVPVTAVTELLLLAEKRGISTATP
jgi:3',5'-nucleoside bisphosphate phosphatase